MWAAFLSAALLAATSSAPETTDFDGAVVAQWLQQIGLPPTASTEYAARVREEAVDVAMFDELLEDPEGLRALGVSNALHRARIAARWRERAAGSTLLLASKQNGNSHDGEATPKPAPPPMEHGAADVERDAGQAQLTAERAEPERLDAEQGDQQHVGAEQADQRLTVTLYGRSGVYFTTAGDEAVVVTAVHADLPAARAGLATGWIVVTVNGRPCKGLPSLQRALAAAEESDNPSVVELGLAPPSAVMNLDTKAQRRLQKRGNAAAKKLRAACGGDRDMDATVEFYRLASNLNTMTGALRLAVESEAGNGGAIDLERSFVLPADHPAGSGRTSLLGHVLSMVTRTLGLLGGVKLGLAPGTARYRSSHLSDSGATEAIALAKWLARRVVNPSQPSAAGYPPVFYAVALREYELTHILVAERAVAVDDGGPNPYLPTPIHVLLQLPDERVQLARELLRRNSAAGPAQGTPTGLDAVPVDGSFNQTDAYAPEQFADGLLFSTELRALFEGISRGGGAMHTLAMGDLALAVHSWQLPFLVLLLAHSADAPALVARTDAWQRNVAHMAARAGNTRAVSLLPLREEALSAQDFMGRTALHAAAMHGYTATVRVLLYALESLMSQEVLTRLHATRDKSGKLFQELHPRARAPVTPAASDDHHVAREPYVPTGGWARTVHAASSRRAGVLNKTGVGCEIDVRDKLSAPEFLMQYLVPGRPVLVRGAALDWSFRRAWSKQHLLDTHGELVLPAGAIPYADVFASNASAAVESNTLAAFVERMEQHSEATASELHRPPPYVFFDGIGHAAPDLLESFPTVPAFLDFASEKMIDRTPSAVQWYIGPAGSGAPMHFHGDAWNALAHGRKLWLLLPPAEALYSAEPISTWLEGDYAQMNAAVSRPFHCVQEAGDVLYVPCDWGHGVLNLQTSVGVATEFSWGHGQRG